MPETRRLSVLLEETLADDFDAFCTENSYKKSTFMAHLLREYLCARRTSQSRPAIFGNDNDV